jgi:hypothetical protein
MAAVGGAAAAAAAASASAAKSATEKMKADGEEAEWSVPAKLLRPMAAAAAAVVDKLEAGSAYWLPRPTRSWCASSPSFRMLSSVGRRLLGLDARGSLMGCEAIDG